MLRRLAGLAVFIGLVAAAAGQEEVPPREGLGPAAAKLEAFIKREMKQQDLPAVSVALVEGKQIVWAKGFGLARPKEKVAATAETVYRVGSVSKLFTDLAVMQLVEKGTLDLDAPVTKYLPEFAPRNPFGEKPITLRQLMAHRSGLARESPVGHYFDPTAPTLAATVESLNRTELVYAPGSRTKYSNAAVATVGRVLEKVTGEPFAPYVKRDVTDPLGMSSTSFEATTEVNKALAVGQMWTYDGRTFDAPTFPLGTAPAGNMYSTVLDLGRFLTALLDGGKGPGGQVVKSETLREMFTPQFVPEGQDTGFGLGFRLDRIGSHIRVGHGGAIYGFSTEVAVIPDERLGVAVIVTKDCANATATRIADAALKSLLAVKNGMPLPQIRTTEPMPPDLARSVRGRYVRAWGTHFLDLADWKGRLYLTPSFGGFRVELRAEAPDMVVDDPLEFGATYSFSGESIFRQGASFHRTPDQKPDPPPARWGGLIGEYGWDHDTLYILEWGGKLYALIEWFFYDPLEEVSSDLFKFPDRGLYDGESLRFTRDANGRATQVVAANVLFRERPIDGEDGKTFRIRPVRPVAELRPEALAATPPVEKGEFNRPNFVDLTTLDPTIKLDIRYATDNNFLGTPFYSSARAFLQKPAAGALRGANQALNARGFGLLIHDAYRPWYVTRMFWDATPESGRGFVADPSKGSKHNRGCAVDLSLYELDTGKPVHMVGGYDEFSTRSNPDYPGGTSLQRWHRDLLRRTMENYGFTVNEVEWWHFDYIDWPHYAILNAPFEKIEAPEAKR